MARDLDGTIAERSRTMLGLLTLPVLDTLGVSRQQRRTLVARGVLVPLGGGVLRHAAHPVSWRQTALAGVLAAGPDALASLATAAALWRFEGIVPPPVPDVLVRYGRYPRSGPGHVHRSRDLTVADADRVELIPVTTPARTICDLSSVLPADRLEAVLDHAERRGLVWIGDGWPATKTVHRPGDDGVREATGSAPLGRPAGAPGGAGIRPGPSPPRRACRGRCPCA